LLENIKIPPFKTQGIKTKLVPLIKANTAFNDNCTWIEPFMGSGVVGLNIAPKNAVFADINPHIINFYNQLKDKSITANHVRSFLIEQGELLLAKGEEHYYYVRDRFNKTHDPIDFLFLNRSCFNGMIRFNKKNGFNVPFCRKPNRFAKAYITKIVNQVSYFEQIIERNNWVFLCQSFESTILMAENNSFIYCDPPYVGRHVDYFDSWDEKSEYELRKCLVQSRANFMVSSWSHNDYRANPYMDTVWGDCTKITKEHFYFVGASESNRNSVVEALLTNYTQPNVITNENNCYEQLQIAMA